MSKAFGRQKAAILGQRLFEIAGAPSLEALRALPAIEVRDGEIDGQFVVVVDETLGIVCEVTDHTERSGAPRAGREVTIIQLRSRDQ